MNFHGKIHRKSVVGLVILSALQPSKSGVRICSESLQRQGGATCEERSNQHVVSFVFPALSPHCMLVIGS